MRRAPLVLACSVVMLLAAGSLSAYTIYLKDGTHLVSRGKYKVQGEQALITLPNGTTTSMPLEQIDEAKTEARNRADYGNALVLEDGQAKQLGDTPAAEKKPTLSDMIAQNQATLRALPEARREAPESSGRPGKTLAGFDDLGRFERVPLSDIELGSALRTALSVHSVNEVELYQGTGRGRVLVEIITNSEAALFQGLVASARALLEVRQSALGNRVSALELVMVTPARSRAGQFVLSPDLAAELGSKRTEVAAFYVKNVQF